jgi:hypothetical protein
MCMGKTRATSWWGGVVSALVAFAALTATALLAGCAAGQAGKAKPSGFLGDYSKLHEGAKGQALMVYLDPHAHFGKYTKIMIDPITLWRNADTKDIPVIDAMTLVDDLDDALRITLDEDYELVKTPGPDVLRVRVAITEAEGSWRVVGNLGDRMDPDLRAVATNGPSDDTRSFVGKAGVEAELMDSVNATRLAAAIDRRAGARTLKPEKNAWDDVEDAFRYWAERLRDRLRELRKTQP